ncbi:MAG: DUF5131 family protein [Thermodesulfobacteriota bacterium]
MNRTKIEYADWTWNPIVGCKHGCFYCYGERLNDRFKWIPNWNIPGYYDERLEDPLKEKTPSRILVGSMCDLLGDWVVTAYIQYIIDVTGKCPHHTFLFLTKNPKRYQEFEFPENCWLGMTVSSYCPAFGVFHPFYSRNQENKKWISFEPLLYDPYPLLEDFVFKPCDWIVIGAMTGRYRKDYPVKKEWIEKILMQADKWSIPVFMKDNLNPYWDEEWRSELP